MRLFAYRLALHLGVWDVDGMLQSMTATQLRDWAEYAEVEPFGAVRADLGHAIVASTVANVWAAKGKRYAPKDFMPEFGAPAPRRQTVAQMHDTFRQFAAAHNARLGHASPK